MASSRKENKNRKGRRRNSTSQAVLSTYAHIQNKLHNIGPNIAPPRDPSARLKEEELNEDIREYETIPLDEKPPRPKGLPRKFKRRSKLKLPFQKEEDQQKKTSANRKNSAFRVDETNLTPENCYVLKKNKHISIFDDEASIAEGEVVCAAWAKFLAPGCVPTMRVWFDDKTFEIDSRTSKNIPGFVTNSLTPLKEEDTIISLNVEDEIEKEIVKERASLSEAVATLLATITDRKAKEVSYTSYIPGVSILKDTYQRNLTSGENSTKLIDLLEEFVKANKDIKFSAHKLKELLTHLRARGRYILEHLNDENHAEEIEILRATINTNDYLYRLTQKTTVPLAAVPILELLYRKACHDEIDVSTCDPDKKIELQFRNKTYSIRAKYLDNYRIIARQITQLTTRYLIQDTDGHNQNMSRDGWMIDFDMAMLQFLFQFRKSNFWDKLKRAPHAKMFIMTPYDVLHFPAIKDADFYYWAAPAVNSKSLSKFSWTYPANFFRPEDNEVFCNLEHNQAAVFHKFKQFLKYSLCDESMFENIARLHMRPIATYFNKKEKKKKLLLPDMVADVKERIHDMREVLVRLPAFQDFLDIHGEFVFSMIEEEIQAFRDKYVEKIEAKKAKALLKHKEADVEDYERLVKVMDMDEIKRRYKEIFKDAARYRNSPDELKKNQQPELRANA